MDNKNKENALVIEEGRSVLGIEFGSTRIKAVLTDEQGRPLASGSFEWENQLVNGLWTYSLEDIWYGLQSCYKDLKNQVKENYGVVIRKLKALGFSAMMHGYMAFDKEENLLVPFRTWRNTNTGKAAAQLTKLFDFNIPLRWSIAHLYEAILEKEEHVDKIDYMTTLAGYIHWKLSGRRCLGIGDAAGMFPVDSNILDYDQTMLDKFDDLVKPLGFPWKIRQILPQVMSAGTVAGALTDEGAALLDVEKDLESGCPMCPPEGDAGTGMAATNSVAVRTGNVSAGTSVFAMIVLEKALNKVHEEVDMVTTPSGAPVAMVHCNNCTSDLNAWVGLFKELTQCLGFDVNMNTLYSVLYNKALEGDEDCGKLMAFNYYSGEPVTGFDEGRPLFVRRPDSNFNLANFMRTNLFSALGALKVGLDILFNEEDVRIDKIYGHGGLFKTPVVGQQILAAAIHAPVTVMDTAGEGGAWGIALLAAYMVMKEEGESLEAYLEHKIFCNSNSTTVDPQETDERSFDSFIEKYKKACPVEKAAVEHC